MHSPETLRIFTKLPNRRCLEKQALRSSCKLWEGFLGTGAGLLGDTALLSGMAILGRTPLTAGLRVTWDIFQISCCCYSPSLNRGLIVSLSTLWSPRNLLSLGFKGFGFESSFYLLVLLFIHCFCKPYCLCLLIYSNCLFYILVSCLF